MLDTEFWIVEVGAAVAVFAGLVSSARAAAKDTRSGRWVRGVTVYGLLVGAGAAALALGQVLAWW
ncbi:MAG: hypothetical protein U0237_15625 [Thermoleophilia bacterium]